MDDLLAECVAEARDMMEALSGEIVSWEPGAPVRKGGRRHALA